jgi:hypothetical protein
LGWHLNSNGRERFTHLTPHPESSGEYNKRGTIAEYLDAQGAEPFIKAAKEYFQWLRAASDALGLDAVDERRETTTEDSVDVVPDLFDMDTAIAKDCAVTGAVEPADLEERMQLHLAILYRQLRAIKGERHDKS